MHLVIILALGTVLYYCTRGQFELSPLEIREDAPLIALTLNVGGIATHPLRIIRLVNFLRSVRYRYDIICLQEVFLPWFLWVWVPIYLAMSDLNIVSMPVQIFGVSGGTCILSKHSLKYKRHKIFSESTALDSLSSKGVLVVEMRLPGGTLMVAGTHMQDSFFDSSGRVRASQLKELDESVGGEVDVVMGDFNICQTRDKELLERAEKLLGRASRPGAATVKEGNIFDYAFGRSVRRSRVLTQVSTVSDHYPVEIELDYSRVL